MKIFSTRIAKKRREVEEASRVFEAAVQDNKAAAREDRETRVELLAALSTRTRLEAKAETVQAKISSALMRAIEEEDAGKEPDPDPAAETGLSPVSPQMLPEHA